MGIAERTPRDPRYGDRRNAPKKFGASSKPTTSSGILALGGGVAGGLIYGLAEGAGNGLWEPASNAMMTNPWASSTLGTVALLAVAIISGGRARICSILLWMISKIEGRR